jgi:hypothetical protein
MRNEGSFMTHSKNVSNSNGMARSLDRILPEDLRVRGIPAGNELLLPYDEALIAIRIANEHEIAILGLEAFEVQKDGLLTIDMVDPSTFIRFTGNWKEYVAMTNAESERWLREHQLGEDHGYILTSTSFDEFSKLKAK